ncbi:MAG: hypothetical protein Ta2E_03610 [Mycoplasmoidaceae bacterium]|nr:MAG: hypothetical protein Ta2E_03610 [Mycoplasmoidaceae bacterium]
MFEDIIDKEKVRKKMKQTTREGNSNKAPGWFKSYVDAQKKFNKQLNDRLDKRDADEVNYRKEIQMNIIGIKDYIDDRVNEVVKEMRDGFTKQGKFNEGILVRLDKIEKDINNIVEKNNLKR